jgi:Tol biopolymer transport system component
VSRNGWIVYAEGAARQRRLTLIDRRGNQTPLAVDPQRYSDPRFSPNGNDVVVTVLRQGGGLLGDLWIVNIPRATMSRLTFEGTDQFPDWSADGRRVVYTTLRPNNGVYWKPAGGGVAELVLKFPDRTVFDAVFTHDTKRIVFRLGGIPGDLHYVDRDSSGTPHVLVASRFDERAQNLSPDDHWVAYVSDETGRDEVYVRPFPESGGRWVISTAGGSEPRWSRDGKELFYRNADTLFAVRVETQPTFSVGQRTALFSGPFLRNPRHATYDIHPDGHRFIFITGDSDESGELMLVQNAIGLATHSRAAAANR